MDWVSGGLPVGGVEVDYVELGGWVDGGLAMVFSEEEGRAEVCRGGEDEDVCETSVESV